MRRALEHQRSEACMGTGDAGLTIGIPIQNVVEGRPAAGEPTRDGVSNLEKCWRKLDAVETGPRQNI